MDPQTLMRYRMEFGVGLGVRRVRESDPATAPMPHAGTLRRLMRNHLWRMGRIVGYEYRKAAGCPRYHTDPKSLGIIKGITS